MDEMKLQKALAMLEAIVTQIPGDGVDIEETYVDLYHQTLTTIETELRCDFSEFRIPSGEVTRHVTSSSYGPRLPRHPRSEKTYSQERYCDGPRFQMALMGAVNFINRLLAPTAIKRVVGFGKTE